MRDNKEKKETKVGKTVKDLNLKIVRPVSINEINKLSVLLKKDSK